MKRLSLLMFLLFAAGIASYSQNSFPKTQREDKDKIMSEAYWKLWNPEVQKRIDKDIDQNRKADAVFDLPEIPSGTEVQIEQVSHDFIFGAHIFNFNQLGTHERNEKYKELYGTLFNSATIAFYWKVFEMEPNRLRFVEEYWDKEEYWNNCQNPKEQPHWRRPSSDVVVDFCEKKGIRLHGHTLIWGNRKWQNPNWIIEKMMTPDEKKELDKLIIEYGNLQNYKDYETYNEDYKNMTPEQFENKFPDFTKKLKEIFKNRIARIAQHYGNRINSWDVVNESATDYGKGLMVPGSKICKSTYGIMPGDYTYEAFKVAQECFSNDVKLNINDYNLTQAYSDQVNDLLKRGCKIDIMGSQMHLFNPQQCLDIAEGKEIQTPDQVWDWANRLGNVGLPIHLSEITITAPGDDLRGRQIQAIIAQNLYRLWFSIKPMMGITWWNVVDDCGAPGEPSVSGLFDRDMKPKPSFYALNNLINNEWKTKLTVKMGNRGAIRFRGFKGKYRVSWKDADGNMVSKEFYLK